MKIVKHSGDIVEFNPIKLKGSPTKSVTSLLFVDDLDFSSCSILNFSSCNYPQNNS
jgi:hypothetical protein